MPVNRLLKQFLTYKACTKRQLLSLLGHLAFASRVVKQGRTFVANMLGLASSKTELHQFIILTPDVRADMFMWLSLLETWNGVSVFGDKEFTLASTLRLFTDSSSTIGFGAYLQSSEQFLVDSWRNHPLPVTDRSMSYLELYPIVISAIVWGESWKGRKILLFSDNQGTVSILNKGRSQCPEINKLMRKLVIICTRFNFTLSAKWISTKDNFHADLLSRGRFTEFQELCPNVTQIPCPQQQEIFFPPRPSTTDTWP